MTVTVTNVTKRLHRKTILNNISITFPSGHITGLVGPNGSGKTMLLRAICGFIKLQQGTIDIDGKRVEFNKPLPSKMGVIIENPGFVAARSGYDNLRYLASLDDGWDDVEVSRLLRKFDLNEFANERVRSYSLGMRQKLGIIQALMEHQKVILLDEPTNGLDKRSVEIFLDEMLYQRSIGRTIVIASHHRDEIDRIADLIVPIHDGCIGTIENIERSGAHTIDIQKL